MQYILHLDTPENLPGLRFMLQCNYLCNMKQSNNECRVITPHDLIGAGEVCRMLEIDRGTLSRWVAKGKLVPLAQLDGPRGAFIFDRNDIPAGPV